MALCWGSPRNKKKQIKLCSTMTRRQVKQDQVNLNIKKTGSGFETGFVSGQGGVLKMILKLFRVVWVVRANYLKINFILAITLRGWW